jgi:hypothetical protein
MRIVFALLGFILGLSLVVSIAGASTIMKQR